MIKLIKLSPDEQGLYDEFGNRYLIFSHREYQALMYRLMLEKIRNWA